MIQLTKLEALYIEEVLQEMVDTVEYTEEAEEALNIIRSCNEYSEEDMITLEEVYAEDTNAEYLNYK